MSIPQNLLHFSEDEANILRHSHSNFLYLFKTKPDDEDGTSFVKIGLTEKQTLLARLDDYKPYTNVALTIRPSKIHYIHTNDVRLRETLIKRVLNKHPEIEVYHNAEYFKGPYDILLKIFSLIALKDIEYLSRYSDIDQSLDLLNTILELEEPLSEEDSNCKTLSCSKCGKECKDKKGLTLHESKCEKVNKLNCSFCNALFQTNSSVIRHEKTCNAIKEEARRKEQEEKDIKHKNELRELKDSYEQQLSTLRESYEVQIRDIKQKTFEVNNFKNRCTDDIYNHPEYISIVKELEWTKQALKTKQNDYIDLIKKKDELKEQYDDLIIEYVDLTKETRNDKNEIIKLLKYMK